MPRIKGFGKIDWDPSVKFEDIQGSCHARLLITLDKAPPLRQIDEKEYNNPATGPWPFIMLKTGDIVKSPECEIHTILRATRKVDGPDDFPCIPSDFCQQYLQPLGHILMGLRKMKSMPFEIEMEVSENHDDHVWLRFSLLDTPYIINPTDYILALARKMSKWIKSEEPIHWA